MLSLKCKTFLDNGHQFAYRLVPLSELPPLSILWMVQDILYGVLPRYLFLWWDFSCRAWFRKILLFIWGIFSFSSLFFYLSLFDGVCFQYSQETVIFLRYKRSWFSSFIPSIVSLFPLFIVTVAPFSILIIIINIIIPWEFFTSEASLLKSQILQILIIR